MPRPRPGAVRAAAPRSARAFRANPRRNRWTSHGAYLLYSGRYDPIAQPVEQRTFITWNTAPETARVNPVKVGERCQIPTPSQAGGAAAGRCRDLTAGA